jgi:glycosyltransferase involved in cell wall biosynthesis
MTPERDPFFSVIIPTINREGQLQRAIESVLMQDFTDFELIVVFNVARPENINYADSRVKIIQELSKGANKARNAGIRESKGKFVCFLDDDDVLLANHLSELKLLIDKNEGVPGLYRTLMKRQYADGTVREQKFSFRKSDDHPIFHLFKVGIVMNSVCLHREIFESFLFDPEIPVAQDTHMWVRVLTRYPLFESDAYTNIYLYSENSISSPGYEVYKKYYKVFSDLFRQPEIGNKIPHGFKNNLLSRYPLWILKNHSNEISLEEFFIWWKRLICHKPFGLLMPGIYINMLKKIINRR